MYSPEELNLGELDLIIATIYRAVLPSLTESYASEALRAPILARKCSHNEVSVSQLVSITSVELSPGTRVR